VSVCIICAGDARTPYKGSPPVCDRCKKGIGNYRNHENLDTTAEQARVRVYWIYAARFGVESLLNIIPSKSSIS